MLKKITQKKRILLVDDDASVSQMLTMLLESRGYEVTTACSSKETFEKVSNKFDLILLDLILPDEDGFNVCRKLKECEAAREIPIIILSAKILHKDIIEGLYMGADDYLTKPFEYEELVARMEAVMRRGSMFRNGNVASVSERVIVSELRRIIDEGSMTPFFQPIFLLKPFKLYGFEALCRPKTESMLANPELLFKAAVQYGCYHELETVAWQKAIEYAAGRLHSEVLFLNCDPYMVQSSNFLKVKSIFNKSQINNDKIVLEITERSAISDFDVFYQNLNKFREEGFKFAVDDVGGGYSSLESIVETKPELVKIDRHIVTNMKNDNFKRSIVKFIVSFCKENNILCIAEGIETKEDLESVIALGVDAGQGYYLHKPSPKIDLCEMDKVVSSF